MLELSEFDRELWEKVCKGSKLARRYQSSKDRGASVLGSYFKYSPTIQTPDSDLGKELGELMKTDPYQKVRPKTTLNLTTSAVTSVMYLKEVAKTDEQEAAKKAAEAQTMMESFTKEKTSYGTEIGKLKDLEQVDELVKSFDKLSQHMSVERLVSILGQMRSIQGRVRKSKSGGQGHVTGIEFGDKLLSGTSSELAMFANPATRLLSMKKIAEREISQYRQAGYHSSGRGDIILCIDNSGSMGDNDKDVASKALALSMIKLAVQDNRNVSACYFTDEGGIMGSMPRITVDTSSMDIGAVVNFICRGANGGTSFEAPIAWATRALQRSRGRVPDIVFLTDGCGTLPKKTAESFVAAKGANNARMHTIIIDDSVKAPASMENISKGYHQALRKKYQDGRMTSEEFGLYRALESPLFQFDKVTDAAWMIHPHHLADPDSASELFENLYKM